MGSHHGLICRDHRDRNHCSDGSGRQEQRDALLQAGAMHDVMQQVVGEAFEKCGCAQAQVADCSVHPRSLCQAIAATHETACGCVRWLHWRPVHWAHHLHIDNTCWTRRRCTGRVQCGLPRARMPCGRHAALCPGLQAPARPLQTADMHQSAAACTLRRLGTWYRADSAQERLHMPGGQYVEGGEPNHHKDVLAARTQSVPQI
jgi:hypothetical protein